MNTESEQAWARHEQAELKRQAEWLRNERAKARGEIPVKPKEKPKFFGKRLGKLKALFGKG